MVGSNATGAEALGGPGIVSNMVIAVIILLAGFVVGKLAGKLLHKILHDIAVDSFLRKALKVKLSAEELVSAAVTYAIYLLAIVSALRRIGIATSVLNIILVLALAFAIVSALLGIRDFIPNAIAGLQINQKRALNEGDCIRVKGTEGKVVKINITETIVETRSHDMIHVPNSVLTKNVVVKLKKKLK